MLQIHFETEQQALRIKQIILQQNNSVKLISNIHYEHSDTISLAMEEQELTAMLHMMRRAFVTYIQKDVLSQWLQQIVQEKFFFTDQEESIQIVELAVSIMQEDKEKCRTFWDHIDQKMYHGLLSIFERKVSFSFPSFLFFRLRGMLDYLITYVETAIDEYKMEQDYQSFVHTLRSYMLSVPPKIEKLHLLHHHYFQFYNDCFKKIEREELTGFIDRRLFSDYPMYIDSNVLAPLISIAPKHLYIYSDEEDIPLVLTITRIFEERVSILSREMFDNNQIHL
ncbi:sporulation protein YtxC [Bacillus massiliigorillae]|uniref:sporulation protein YtxC n=1 Tax=Bacillus massiliigorillae TaxID=1243664 RepID=UPI0003A0B750|nr:sporulation protein YtxC [Bacillus massiliigorillae]